ncbi:ornithine--oxo-acid transaminase [Streptomyces sp. NPDC001661]
MAIPTAPTAAGLIAESERYGAANYAPLPVVISSADGCWVTDTDGRRYLDLLAGYSALNFGHGHPRLTAAAMDQLQRVTLTSRAFHHDLFGRFCRELADLCGMEMVLPMNTGAEAVETAVKTARKWAHTVKGVPDGQSRIVVADGNFHGRTTTVVSFSSDPDARTGFGPFTPGFDMVPYGDLAALENAITPETAAILIEPVQGEAGVVVPPTGYLSGVREVTQRHRVLFIADEIQSGLGRTGRTFACDHEEVHPDVYLLGKALGGGVVPVSAVVSRRDVLDVIRPGEHGSTFGGNPLACAVALEVIALMRTGVFQQAATDLGERMHKHLSALAARTETVTGIRGRGLWAGLDIAPSFGTARQAAERLQERGVLVKDTHGQTLRLAPPLCITADELDGALATLEDVLTS